MNQHRYLIIVISLFLFCLISCSEDLSTFEEIEVITERPEVLVNAEIIGLVVNNNQDPIPDAIVSINNMEATTDLNGFFSISGRFNQIGTAIRVQKAGYFDSHRLITATDGGVIQTELLMTSMGLEQMSPSTEDLSFQGDGYNVDITGGSFALASQPYDGAVSLTSRYIDVSSTNDSQIIEGDLLGRNEVRSGLLTPYSMVEVILTGESGENLELTAPASLSMAIPQVLRSEAPAEAPLFFYDVDQGIWIEDGTAIRVGNNYEAQVDHFTIWVVAELNGLVVIEGQISSESDNYPYANYRLDRQGVRNTLRTRIADQNGQFVSLLNPDDAYDLNILDDCGNIILSEEVITMSDDISVSVDVGPLADQLILSGFITDCDGNVTTDGYVRIEFADNGFRKLVPLDDEGAYTVAFDGCSSQEVTIIGFDVRAGLQSTPDVLSEGHDPEVSLTLCEEIDQGVIIREEGREPIVINNCFVSVAVVDPINEVSGTQYSFFFTDFFPEGSLDYSMQITLFEEGVVLQGPTGDFFPDGIIERRLFLAWDVEDIQVINQTDEIVELHFGVGVGSGVNDENGEFRRFEEGAVTVEFIAQIL